jgi:hypothetical protein
MILRALTAAMGVSREYSRYCTQGQTGRWMFDAASAKTLLFLRNS